MSNDTSCADAREYALDELWVRTELPWLLPGGLEVMNAPNGAH